MLRDEIAKEKGRLIKSAIKKGGNGIVNIDNSYIEDFIIKEELDVYGVSNSELENPKLLRILEAENTTEGFCATYQNKGNKYKLNVTDALLGEEYAYTFGFAIQTGLLLGIDIKTAVEALETYKAPEGRFRLLKGIKNSKIIDSTYNSSPVTLEQALYLFSKYDSKGRKILVLGDMRELGDIEKTEHERIARIAAKLNFHKFYLVGKNMTTHFADELRNKGISESKIHSFENSLKLGKTLKNDIQEMDFVLAKGSQNTIFLEEAIKQILEAESKPDEPSSLLCRQSKWWLERKMKFFNI